MKRPGDKTRGASMIAAALAAVVLCIGIVVAAREAVGCENPPMAGLAPGPVTPAGALPAWRFRD